MGSKNLRHYLPFHTMSFVSQVLVGCRDLLSYPARLSPPNPPNPTAGVCLLRPASEEAPRVAHVLREHRLGRAIDGCHVQGVEEALRSGAGARGLFVSFVPRA